VHWKPAAESRRVNLDALTREEVAGWKPGQTLLLSGRMLTGRDAAHKRLAELLNSGKGLPPGVDLRGRVIYYVGPVDAVRDEAVGPAGPTTATRMDKFTDQMLEKTGLLHDRQGRARADRDRSDPQAQIRLSHCDRRRGIPRVESDPKARVVAFDDLGMEAIYEFEVKDMPVTVAVDSLGESVHVTGPREWKRRSGN
jgi:fumarate hydratase class I